MTNGLSVIIPAYNESPAIETGKLSVVSQWLRQQGFPVELIVVDDGSTDNTCHLAGKFADRVIRIDHKGKAAAIITGIQSAEQETVLFTDMDQATPITEAPRLIKAIEAGTEIAIGNRGLVRQGAPPGRYLLSFGHMVLHRLLLGLRINDTQCGFKAFRREVALAVLDRMVVYDMNRIDTIDFPSVSSGFDTEFLFVAQKMGYRIAEVPVLWNYQETRRVDLTRDAFRGLADLLGMVVVKLKKQYPEQNPGHNRKNSTL